MTMPQTRPTESDAMTATIADISPKIALQALLAQELMPFTAFAFGVVRPGIPFKPNWHLEAVTHKLSQVAKGEVRRLIITLPPRNLKSLCASVALPAWFLGHYPGERVVVVSYSDFLSRAHANDFRRLVNDPLYQATLPQHEARSGDRPRDHHHEAGQTDRDLHRRHAHRARRKPDHHRRPHQAWRRHVGDRAGARHRMVPLDPAFARRRQDKDAYRRGHATGASERSRRLPAGARRLRGLKSSSDRARSQTYDLGGGRTYTRQQGELLHPKHESADTLIELKREMGPIAFSAQYQQSPIPPGGTIIKRKWLTTYDQVGFQPGDRIVMSWDIALSEMESGDYSACVVLLDSQ